MVLIVLNSGFISSAALWLIVLSPFLHLMASLQQTTHTFSCVRMCEHTFLSPIKTVTSSLTLWLYAVNDASSILNHFLGNVKLFADCNTSFRADVQLWETCFKIVLKSFATSSYSWETVWRLNLIVIPNVCHVKISVLE